MVSEVTMYRMFFVVVPIPSVGSCSDDFIVIVRTSNDGDSILVLIVLSHMLLFGSFLWRIPY